jgi:hypothetical protein
MALRYCQIQNSPQQNQQVAGCRQRFTVEDPSNPQSRLVRNNI